MSKSILFISNYKKGVGGISAQIDLLRINLHDDEYDTDIFSTKGNAIKRIGLFAKLLWGVRTYDVLHIHGCSDWGMLPVVYGVIVGKIWRKRIIVTYHGGEAAEYFAKHGAFARRWLGRADRVIVLSGFLLKVFNDYQIPCIVIPNIVELPVIEHKHDRDANAPKFISVRHLRELYNIPCILRAFKWVQAQLPDASLTVLGSGPQLEELQLYVRENQLNHVSFVGQVPNKEMNEYLAKHDVFLSAPRVDNMPVSVLEAMNAGVLVISSRVGGVPYMIEHGRTGLLFDYDDDKALAEQMLWATEHIAEAGRIVEEAMMEVKKYSWTNIRKQLLPLYE